MKKALILLLITFVLLAGCGSQETGDRKSATPSIHTGESPGTDEDPEDDMQEGASENDFPGTYTVPEGWVKAAQYSTASKIFYVEEGHEKDELPDNISINIGTNKYSKEDHMSFRDAIVSQLLRQLQGIDAELLGDGTCTEQGYVVYIFTINEQDVVTRQYYIVDDYRYCLVHLTNYTGSENAKEAALAIVDSFIWEDAGE